MPTSYTPYQPEVAQGTLQITYEFQSLVSQLMSMEVANAGMYDGATALAEAALMACRLTSKERIAVLDTVSPANLSVIRTYTDPQGLDVYTTSPSRLDIQEGTACLVVQNPNFYGYLEDMNNLGKAAHDEGALFCRGHRPGVPGYVPLPRRVRSGHSSRRGPAAGSGPELRRPLRGAVHVQVQLHPARCPAGLSAAPWTPRAGRDTS